MRPDTFIDALNARCNITGQRPYRLRWDPHTETFALEQKVSRAIEIPAVGDDFVTARVRDGYGLVLNFAPAPTMRCPDCGTRLPLAVMKSAEVRCDFCAALPDTHDRQMWFLGYFPLCDRFLTYLERTSPKRAEALLKQMDRDNNAVLAQSRQKLRTNVADVAGDYWHQVAETPRVGYGNGPASFGRL